MVKSLMLNARGGFVGAGLKIHRSGKQGLPRPQSGSYAAYLLSGCGINN